MITCRLEYEIWHDDPLWVGNIIKCRPHPIQGGRASGGGQQLSCLVFMHAQSVERTSTKFGTVTGRGNGAFC